MDHICAPLYIPTPTLDTVDMCNIYSTVLERFVQRVMRGGDVGGFTPI